MRPSLRPRELLGLLPLQMISVTSAAPTSRRARAGAKAVQEGLPRLFILTRNAVAAAYWAAHDQAWMCSSPAGPRELTRTSQTDTNHTLLVLRQQIHPRIPPQRLQIHDDGAVAPPIQKRGMAHDLRDVARPARSIEKWRHLVLRQRPR